jgi:PLAT/LH2 domain-containing protein
MIKAAPHDPASEILDMVHRYLTPVGLNVIISVADLTSTWFFEKIRDRLGSRTGLMVDSENDPEAVSTAFAGVANQCYGNGIADLVRYPTFAPHIRPSVERACALSAARGDLKFVYTWSVGEQDSMREYIRIGTNGIIAGDHPMHFDADSVSKLRRVTGEGEFRSLIRLASRDDNPFTPANAAYALTVHTDARHNAGTDANVTFTLNGTFGSYSKTVDTSLIGSVFGGTPGRMENGLDYVTLPSTDLGDLKSITVQRDNQGNAPGWFLNWIHVASGRYSQSKQASFERWIDTNSPFVQSLI